MILLQLSAGQGPDECARAVALATGALETEGHKLRVCVQKQKVSVGESKGCYKSVLLSLEGEKEQVLAERWTGNLLWICPSPFRKGHRRKNWFFSGQCFPVPSMESVQSADFRFQTCRASGAGGQHVNTTDSAVQATHIPSGLQVKVQSERSQHANKRLAVALLLHKLESQSEQKSSEDKKQRRQQHWTLERGNPKRVFYGPRFQLKDLS